jgi:ligand-binding sensor domain-containing protein/two-component sensor histidine kinase
MQIRFLTRKCILLLLLFLVHSVCNGQPFKYRFRIINLPEIFKNQHISLVDEDAAGMLWFVTTSGLHRYDGNQVLTFDMQSTPALPDADIRQLVADNRNRIWIVAHNILVCFNLQNWSTHIVPFRRPAAALQGVGKIAEGKDGTLYAASGNNLYRVVGDSLNFITSIDLQEQDYINSIREPVPGELLLTTAGGKIVSIQHRHQNYAPASYFKIQKRGNTTVRSAIRSRSEKYLINVNGLYEVDMTRKSAIPLLNLQGIPTFQSKGEITVTDLKDNQAVFFYKNWKAGETGLVVYNAEKNTAEDLTSVYPAGFKYNMLRAMNYKNGHILIPVKGGIATVSYTSKAFDMLDASMENENSIRTIYKEPGGRMLIGSYLYGFYKFDEDFSTSTNRSEILVSCLVPWQKDTLLTGTEGGGLRWYLPATNRLISLSGTAASRQVNPFVNCLTRESDTSVWVGTNGGVHLINPYTGRILQSSMPEGDPPSPQSMVFDILKVRTSRFFATREGLFKYNVLNKSWTKLLASTAGNYANSYFTCLQLAHDQIWAGTVGNGMLVLDTAGNLLRKITKADGLAGNIIFSNPVFQNYLLVGTRTGLSIINLRSGKISNYSSEYYLPADEFNRSAWYINGDTAYMGTINGFIRLSSKQLHQQQDKVAPGICLSGFTYFNGSGSHSDYTLPYRNDLSLTIPPEVNNFSIALGGLSEMAEGLQLYYRMNKYGPWQAIGQRREITFVNIAPDDYTMQIAARFPDGLWRENLLTLPIKVKPHFYQTWWWKTFLFSAAIVLIWLGVKYREKTLRKEEQLRSRIAGDLHDEVGSALTRIYFQAGMLTTTEGKAAASSTAALQQIASSSHEALSSMSDMVWSIDANYDNAPDMVDRIRDYIVRLQDELDCQCTFIVSGSYEHKRLSQVLRQNILLIFKEAINNAIKYGRNKTVAVNLSLNDNELVLKITNHLPDSGIAEHTVQGGHGMKSMQLRADKIKAKLSITNTGDEFVVQLQAKPL